MESIKKYAIFIVLSLIHFCNAGCSYIAGGWTDTTLMEDYADQVAQTREYLEEYVGRNQDRIKSEFGEPNTVDRRVGSKAVYNQRERVQFDEVWGYAYMKGIPMINAASSRKWFYFKDGIVVAVDAS